MLFDRLQDVSTIERAPIEAILNEGRAPTIQFTDSSRYSPELLHQLDGLCAELGARLEVRFYGHYPRGFDARSLAHLPNVAWLSIDCLRTATNLEALSELRHLRKLSLGVFELNQPNILRHLPLENLEELSLRETHKAEIDLSPLSRCRSLRQLHIAGHTHGFDTLAALPSVTELSLRSIPKKQPLAAVSEMKALRALTIILGGRTAIDEIAHPALTKLEIIWVRGLSTLGSLARFPALQHLRIEDQLQLREIDFASGPQSLRHVSIFNCKNLQSIPGFEQLEQLTALRIGRTALEFEPMLRASLPRSLRCVAFYTGRKVDNSLRSRLDALGYTEFES